MKQYHADRIHFHRERISEELFVWCYNDSSLYPNKYRMVEYLFFDPHEDGRTKGMRKLINGLYREPYRDGWKYRINGQVHPLLTHKILEYIEFGFCRGRDGKWIPCKNIRHNRKAYGVHHLISEYVRHYLSVAEKSRHDPNDRKTGLPLLYAKPFFPTSKIDF